MTFLSEETIVEKFKIGWLAKETGIKIETIRYYEKYGLIPKASRRKSGYRKFTQKHIEYINFIKQAKTMDFTLREITEFLALAKKKGGRKELLDFANNKMNYLKRAQQSLQGLVKEIHSGRVFPSA